MSRGCSGKTQWMIDQLVKAVVAGQPKSVVVGHTFEYAALGIRPRVIRALSAAGLSVKTKGISYIEADGSIILFVGPEDVIYRLPAHTKLSAGFFYDHHVDEKGLPMVSNPDPTIRYLSTDVKITAADLGLDPSELPPIEEDGNADAY